MNQFKSPQNVLIYNDRQQFPICSWNPAPISIKHRLDSADLRPRNVGATRLPTEHTPQPCTLRNLPSTLPNLPCTLPQPTVLYARYPGIFGCIGAVIQLQTENY